MPSRRLIAVLVVIAPLWASSVSGASFLRPLAIVSPRIARAGLTFAW